MKSACESAKWSVWDGSKRESCYAVNVAQRGCMACKLTSRRLGRLNVSSTLSPFYNCRSSCWCGIASLVTFCTVQLGLWHYRRMPVPHSLTTHSGRLWLFRRRLSLAVYINASVLARVVHGRRDWLCWCGHVNVLTQTSQTKCARHKLLEWIYACGSKVTQLL